MSANLMTRCGVFLCAILALMAAGPESYGQGIYVSGVGPVNRSMGGAGTAAPIDAIGALNWNPASIGDLPGNELAFGVELLTADIQLKSNVGPGTSGDAGFVPIPSIGWVHHVQGTPLTVGLGVFAVAGFKNNQPGGNLLLGGAPAAASAEFLQVVPTISYELSDTLSVGLAPTITIGELNFTPLGPSVIVPAPATGQINRAHWGGGFQAGVYYTGPNHVQLGFTFKSPQWMETFRAFTSSAAVPSGVVNIDLDLPMIMSLGVGYTGIEDWTFAADFRYFGYKNADGFNTLGWRDILGAAFGVQRQLNESLSLRAGINFNEAPIHADAAFRNTVSPLIQRYNVSMGGSFRLNSRVEFNLAYVYLGKTSVSGPFAPVPGVQMTHDLSAHSGIFGMTVRY